MSGRNGVDLVCFDLGRVLMRICDGWRHACEVAGVPVPTGEPDAAAAARLHDAVCRSEVGAIDLRGFAEAAAPLLGLTTEHVIALSNAYCRGPYPGAAELIDDLAAAGVTTACLSNTNANHWRILTDPEDPHGRVVNRLTHRFASHLVRARKPDEAIYAHVERETGCARDRIIFFDDLPENVEAARRRGWRAHRVDPADPIAQIRNHLRGERVLV